ENVATARRNAATGSRARRAAPRCRAASGRCTGSGLCRPLALLLFGLFFLLFVCSLGLFRRDFGQLHLFHRFRLLDCLGYADLIGSRFTTNNRQWVVGGDLRWLHLRNVDGVWRWFRRFDDFLSFGYLG